MKVAARLPSLYLAAEDKDPGGGSPWLGDDILQRASWWVALTVGVNPLWI
jgi:hypothetical protein